MAARGSTATRPFDFTDRHPWLSSWRPGDQIIWKMGVSANVKTAESIAFARITGIFEPTEKTLDEARGYVVADYQEHLEKSWIRILRNKYPIKVNEEAFQSLVRSH